jgi:hypothetical protein
MNKKETWVFLYMAALAGNTRSSGDPAADATYAAQVADFAIERMIDRFGKVEGN